MTHELTDVNNFSSPTTIGNPRQVFGSRSGMLRKSGREPGNEQQVTRQQATGNGQRATGNRQGGALIERAGSELVTLWLLAVILYSMMT